MWPFGASGAEDPEAPTAIRDLNPDVGATDVAGVYPGYEGNIPATTKDKVQGS